VDLKNYFNSIHRPVILGALEQRCQVMLPWVRQAFQPAPLLVGREVIWSTRGVQQGDPVGPFFFWAGIKAALDTMPPWGGLHRWYLDNVVLLGSVAEVEEVLGAFQRTLLSLGLELNLRKTTVCGPGLVPAARPLSQPRHACIFRMARSWWYADPLPPLPLADGGPGGWGQLGTLERKFARTCAAVAALADTQVTQALMRSCLGLAKVQYALRTLSLRHTAAFAADVTATQRADVTPVLRLAGVMQFLARAEPMLGFDRNLVVPLASEAGLLDSLNARLPPTLEPLASWARTGKVDLPNGDARHQHWWSARPTQVKAASLLEDAKRGDASHLEAQRGGGQGDGPPPWRAKASAWPAPTSPQC